MKLNILTLGNQAAGEIELNEAVFGVPVRKDILHRMVNWQLAKRQQGTHHTKGVSEISGTGKKPFKQKGTGNARQGSLRSPQFRGGAVIFGPRSRSHAFDLPKKVRALALKIALSAKIADGKVVVLDSVNMDAPKTKTLAQQLKTLGLESALFIDGAEVSTNFALASRNLHKIDVLPVMGANVYDILRRDTLVLTKEAIAKLEERLA